jgi:deoxyribonuclease-4
MPLIGAHLSIAGGFHKAVEAAATFGMDTVQLFTHSPSQWLVRPAAADLRTSSRTAHGMPAALERIVARPICAADVALFQEAQQRLRVAFPLVHASYLINLAAPEPCLWQQSIDAFVVELQRAEQLRIPAVVVHPGAFTTSSEAAGLRRITAALREVINQTRSSPVQCLLETTAGQGSQLGSRFEQLARLLDRSPDAARIAVCIDTCHLFAAGYPLQTAAEYASTMDQLDQTIGLGRVRAIHLNDSQQPLGSHRDRHAHIGQGKMGLEPFRQLLNDDRFHGVPMYLETPKGSRGKRPWDAINLATLRGLCRA